MVLARQREKAVEMVELTAGALLSHVLTSSVVIPPKTLLMLERTAAELAPATADTDPPPVCTHGLPGGVFVLADPATRC